MIDIHCHLLPEVDDGAQSWEMAEEMCRMSAADGVAHIVATPHANGHYAYDREKFFAKLTALQKRIGPRPLLSLGCDFRLSPQNLDDILASPERYTIEGGRYVLAEPSFTKVPPQVDDYLQRLLTANITPIITHPERNVVLQKNLERVVRWVRMGCAVQLTASALTSDWGETAWHAAQWLLKRDSVHILASDAHDTVRRPPGLSAARDAAAEIVGKEAATALVEDNPRAVVKGTKLPYFPKISA